jgi:dienelactone hydrolase
MGFCFGGLCVLDIARSGADWQLHGYGHTMHAFSNPAARDPDSGKASNEYADRRSWAATRYFLAELFY